MGLAAVNCYIVMWGVPFLTQGHHLAADEVSFLLTFQVLVGMALGPVCGWLSGRFPHHRVLVIVIGVAVLVLAWGLTLAIPGRHSLLGLLPLTAALGLGGALSGIGFDLARTGVRPMSVGTATGFVNVGGFGGGLVAVALVGVLLDLTAGGRTPDLGDHRLALASQGVLLVGLMIGFVVAVRRGGARPADTGPAGPGTLTAAEEVGEEQAQARVGSGSAA
jgi:sugar phosphate permease